MSTIAIARRLVLVLGVCLAASAALVDAQTAAESEISHVANSGLLRADWELANALQIDRGISGLVQDLRRARSTASLLHIVGHPDDEHAAMLTLESRGRGTRTALLSLNRGEGGANALGPELFDELGALRTEELILAGRWYGLDDLYFTTAVDYGYSKSMEEAYRSWDRNALVEDVVRVIRRSRPVVVVSRWHGSVRDGHGHHQAAGDLVSDAVAAAADPSQFPDQLEAEGLEPWTVLRVFRGNVREGEPHHVRVDPNVYSEQLGAPYDRVAAYGLSLQRSQTSGRVRARRGVLLYEQTGGTHPITPGTNDFFEGIDTSIRGLPALFDEAVDEQGTARLVELDQALAEAAASVTDPARSANALVRALGLVRELLSTPVGGDRPKTVAELRRTRRDIEVALARATGVRVEATARHGSSPALRVAAGDAFEVDVQVEVSPNSQTEVESITVHAPAEWRVERDPDGAARFSVHVAPNASPTRPYFSRSDIRESVYAVHDSASIGRAWAPDPLVTVVQLRRAGVTFAIQSTVKAERSAIPFGTVRDPVTVAPRVWVDVPQGVRVLRRGEPAASFEVPVHVTQGGLTPVSGRVAAHAPEGWNWTVLEGDGAFAIDRPGASTTTVLSITPSSDSPSPATIDIVATADGFGGLSRAEFAAGEARVVYPDLQPRSLPQAAQVEVRVLDVALPDAVRVGYVMGVGDAIPEALTSLGASVDLLESDALANVPLDDYDAVFIGTRAYAVRPDLETHNARLSDYVRGGGHLVVLYQTPEYDAARLAPVTVELPRNAEETSEEDAEVRILAPEHPMLSWPNAITATDFDGWVEQRGSKFFSEWGDDVIPLIETADRDQDPQRGVWLSAQVGDGVFTYCALALHRQTPYGVEGAFRILANLAAAALSR